MLRSFRGFLTEGEEGEVDGIPVVAYIKVQPDLHLLEPSVRTEINSDLDEATEAPFSWPLAGYEAICDCLHEHGIVLPENVNLADEHEEFGELLFGVKPADNMTDTDSGDDQIYLYINYAENEDGKYEFYAELVKGEDDLCDLIDDFTEEEDRD